MTCALCSKTLADAASRAGNQAAQNGFNPGFYNGLRHAHGVKARMGQKSLVGSYNVGRVPQGKVQPHQPAGIGTSVGARDSDYGHMPRVGFVLEF